MQLRPSCCAYIPERLSNTSLNDPWNEEGYDAFWRIIGYMRTRENNIPGRSTFVGWKITIILIVVLHNCPCNNDYCPWINSGRLSVPCDDSPRLSLCYHSNNKIVSKKHILWILRWIPCKLTG